MNGESDKGKESELGKIAKSLDALENRIAKLKRQTEITNHAQPDALGRAEHFYRDRRIRDRIFGNPDLFGEPAWDMLLDLFIAAELGKQISVSSLCIASAVPPTTALRWITILESQSLIARRDDPADSRRVFISLTTNAHSKLKAHFERIA